MAPAEKMTFPTAGHDAVVMDLDGVLTRTQSVHALAWKRAFDDFLRQHAGDGGQHHRPFEIDPEYYRHVDGKPRYEGAADFLRSRGIDLPRGEPGDPPGHDSICAIGNRKNEVFLELLETQGVERYDSSLAFVAGLRCAGLRTGVISASRNCVAVLAAAGALGLFDTKVDGRDAAERGLAGKPAPDVFLAAATELEVAPERCAAVEDASAGVEAARRAGYATVIGLNRDGPEQARALAEHGADCVISDLAEVTVEFAGGRASAGLPMPPSDMQAMEFRLGTARPAVFLDYDGTLTPIVERPEDAVLDVTTRRILERVAAQHVTAIVSGRDLEDLRERVGLEGLVYAGSHGFDIRLVDGERRSPEAARDALPALQAAADDLERRLRDIDGAMVERKRYAVTVHYRMVEEDSVAEIERVVDETVRQHPSLRRRGGKKIFELLPDIDWDKGEALRLLLDILDLRDDETTVPVYVGDDETDEDAFAALDESGIGIAVGRDREATIAGYTVEDSDAVRRLLVWMCRRESERP